LNRWGGGAGAGAPWHRRRWLAGAGALVLAACAEPPRTAPAAADHWSGRLGLQVDDPSAPSFSAGFELQGNADRGDLTLLNPLGSVLARLAWHPGGAVLVQDGKQHRSSSLAALTEELTGNTLPVQALFAWLKGEAVQASGWHVDLSTLDSGRISATRLQPLPQAVLRIVLDR